MSTKSLYRLDIPRKGHPWEPHETDFRSLVAGKVAFQGSASEWDALISKLHLLLVSAAFRILGSPRFQGVDRDAEGAAQDWWHNMLAFGFRRYDPGRPFYAYGHCALAHICHSMLRRAKYRRCPVLDFDVAGREGCPSECLLRNEALIGVRMTIRRLPKPQRQALILKYWLGASSQEAAVRLGVPRGTIDRRNFETRQSVAEWLEDYDNT